MARNTSQLRVSFLVDSNRLVTGFRSASRTTDQFARSTQRSARTTAALGATLRRAALAAGGAAAAYLSITQAKQAITTTQELALVTAGLNRNLGLATKEASRWAAVTRARGIDSKTLVMSFTSLSRAIDGVATGSEAALRPFQNLGITQKELSATGGDFQKQILLIADALGEAEGSAQRQASAAKLLGRGYRDVLPLFYEGSRGLQEQLRWADEFGAAMGQDTVDAMSEFTTAQRRGRVAVMGLQIAFAKFATPAVTEIIEGLGDLAAVLNSPSLTKADKLARLRTEFEQFRDRVISIVMDIAPIVADAAGEIGVAMAKAMGKAFTEAGLLGKVAVTAFVLSSFGGPRALITAGAAVGAYISTGMATAMATGDYMKSTFLTARGFGKNIGVAAGLAGAGAAQTLATSFGKTLLRVIPPALALLSIGEIIANALGGDIKSALMKGGGAIAGAIIGGIAGGPVGAMIGIGIGTFGADLAKKLIDGFGGEAAREIPTVAERIAASIERLSAAAQRERSAYRALNRASDYAVQARQRQKAATDRVREAEARLAEARSRFGPSSNQAAAAERRLARAKMGVVAATQRVNAADRLQGVERKSAMVIAEASVRLSKTEIRQLRRKEDRLAALAVSRERAGASDKELQEIGRRQIRVNVASEKAQIRLNETYRRAGREIGPEFAASLRKISGFAASTSRVLPKLAPPVVALGRTSRDTFPLVTDLFGSYADVVQRRSGRVNRNMRTMPRVQKDATGQMLEDLRNKIGVMGDMGSPALERRRGGKITGSTQTVLAALSPGELISWRGREIYVPGRPEPRDSVLMNVPVGAKVFTRDGQMRMAMGATQAQALRDQAPHFQAGGIVKPNITGGSPLANKAGNRAIGIAHVKAEDVLAANAITDLDSVVRMAAKYGLGVSSGYRPGDDGYHGINRARDLVGSASDMYRFAYFLGTKFGHRLLELIYSPLGWSIDNYQRVPPYAVADHYDHVHVAMRKGGYTKNINRIWNEHNAGTGDWGGPTLPSYVVAALAQAAGMPGKTMEQVTRGESGAHAKGTARPGATGIDPGGTKGHGLWMITSGFNEDLAARVGGWRNMLNPVVNAWAAAQIYRRQGLGAWYGTGSVTGDGQNYTGDYDIRNALGGLSFQGALWMATDGRIGKKPPAIEKIGKGSRKVQGRIDRMRKGGGLTPAAKKNLSRAARAAKRAAAFAKQGKITRAQAVLKRARRMVGKAAGNKKPPKQNAPAPPLPPTAPGTGTASGVLPPGIEEALAGPGLTFDDRVSILDRALTIAQGTAGTEDDLAVLRRQRQLQESARDRAVATVTNANAALGQDKFSKEAIRKAKERRQEALAKLKQADNIKDKKRRKEYVERWQEQLKNANAILQRYGQLNEDRSEAASAAASAESEIASIDSQISDITGGDGGDGEGAGDGGGDAGDNGAAELAAAMEELANAIKEQNRLQSSVQAVSSREALKMLSDVISGQIVGKRLPVNSTPTGVRY